jgi:hypothetical protein
MIMKEYDCNRCARARCKGDFGQKCPGQVEPDDFKVSLLEISLGHGVAAIMEILSRADLRLKETNNHRGFELVPR